jgi:hypothetical protein
MIGGAPEDNRVGFSSVVAEMHDHVADLDVLVGQRRGIRSQGGEVADHRRGHAHAGIGLDGVGAENALHEQVLEILPFHGELPGAVEADRVAAVGLSKMSDLVIDHFGGVFIGHPHEVFFVERTLGFRGELEVTVTGLVPFFPDILAHIWSHPPCDRHTWARPRSGP